MSATLPKRKTGATNRAMMLDEIRSRIRGGRMPFIVRLADGRRIKVPRAGTMAVGPDCVLAPNRKRLFERIDASQIMSVEDLPARKRK